MIKCEHGHFYDETKYDSCPYCAEAKRQEGIDSRKVFHPHDEEATMPYHAKADDPDYTVPFYGTEIGNEQFVTGWLVCIEGPARGRDYKISFGYTRIGRGYHMDISIPEDISITRDNHCSIAYDDKKCRFYLVPSGGNLVYLNSALLTKPTQLKERDLIQIGNSVFQFIPFANGDFKW